MTIGGAAEPGAVAVPRLAATVVMLRDSPDPAPGRSPLQVFLQRRVAGMAFAGGMTVFPGGGVDPGDRPDPAHWSGPDPAWWGRRLACEPELAGALVQAAVRETFEECGVLLAGPPEGGAALGPDLAPALAAGREDLVARRRTLADLLAATGLVLRSDLLRGWARWITPPASPRRYDTVFFTAIVPDGQQADAATTEAVEAAWWHPAAALERWQAGEIELMAPTLRTLQQVAAFADAASALAAAAERTITPVIPKVRRQGEQVVVVVPGDPEYATAVDHLSPGGRP
ncbi:NUDIX hydrolase [Pseudonocardia bannensis]|uniref:NUDIX hydrolase n=1 Tax=Pseudonocardia bannensis TaxID=630973 RepID=A0A848DJA7_9PSEU|nr:NUDIX hydrolase [Pseudonocardia bannensis]NMH92655.1 NUDIX hydrolase [Pseudonocardia bannensis]